VHVHLRDHDVRGAAGAREPQDRGILHARGGDLDADVEPGDAERLGRGHALVRERRAEILRQAPELTLGEGADGGEVGGCGRKGGAERRGEQCSFHFFLVVVNP
jgi:hypothetical protein